VPSPTPTGTPTPTPTQTSTPSPTQDPSALCRTSFARHELREPYQKHGGKARYTLSAKELHAYLDAMGVAELCIPPALGAPFLNVDWDSAGGVGVAERGRMISVGFEATYTGGGWSEAFLLYATYDFAAGVMYDTYARPQDRDALRNGTMPGAFEVNGVQGFVRFHPSNFGYHRRDVYKTIVYPFETDYVAVVYHLGDWPADADWDALIQDLSAGAYPPDRQPQATVALVDTLAGSLRFR
jgi:hypothetical protein